MFKCDLCEAESVSLAGLSAHKRFKHKANPVNNIIGTEKGDNVIEKKIVSSVVVGSSVFAGKLLSIKIERWNDVDPIIEQMQTEQERRERVFNQFKK